MSPTPLTKSFKSSGSLILLNTPLSRFLSHEARQRCNLQKNARLIVVEDWNDEDKIMQDLSALPEFEITGYLKKTEKYVGYSVGYKNVDFCL